jgi:hypothetical protein
MGILFFMLKSAFLFCLTIGCISASAVEQVSVKVDENEVRLSYKSTVECSPEGVNSKLNDTKSLVEHFDLIDRAEVDWSRNRVLGEFSYLWFKWYMLAQARMLSLPSGQIYPFLIIRGSMTGLQGVLLIEANGAAKATMQHEAIWTHAGRYPRWLMNWLIPVVYKSSMAQVSEYLTCSPAG